MKNDTLMLIATLAAFGLLYFLLFVPLPDKNVQVFVFLAGSVTGFFFGSSLNKQRPAAPAAPPTGAQP